MEIKYKTPVEPELESITLYPDDIIWVEDGEDGHTWKQVKDLLVHTGCRGNIQLMDKETGIFVISNDKAGIYSKKR